MMTESDAKECSRFLDPLPHPLHFCDSLVNYIWKKFAKLMQCCISKPERPFLRLERTILGSSVIYFHNLMKMTLVEGAETSQLSTVDLRIPFSWREKGSERNANLVYQESFWGGMELTWRVKVSMRAGLVTFELCAARWSSCCVTTQVAKLKSWYDTCHPVI